MRRRHAISPGCFGHYQDQGIASLKCTILPGNLFLVWIQQPGGKDTVCLLQNTQQLSDVSLQYVHDWVGEITVWALRSLPLSSAVCVCSPGQRLASGG